MTSSDGETVKLESAAKLAAQIEEARTAAKRLLGDGYERAVEPWRELVRALARGRPPISGERMVVRSLGLPADVWKKYDAEARRRSVREKRSVSAAELIRERLAAGGRG